MNTTPVATTFDLKNAALKASYDTASNTVTVLLGSTHEGAWMDNGVMDYPVAVACKGHISTKVFTLVNGNLPSYGSGYAAALYSAPCGMKLKLV